MKYLIIGLLSLFSLQVFSQQTPEYREKSYPNGKLMYKGNFLNGKPVGEFIRYYPDGVVKAKMNYGAQKVNVQLYDKVGVLTGKGNYIKGKKDSVWIYYKRGKVILKETYKAGVKNGLSVVYEEDGTVSEECDWRNGLKDGKWIRYYSEGQRKFEATYKNNRLDGEFVAYSIDGNVDTKGNYSDNVKDGEWIYYDYLGAVRLKLKYKNGISDKELDEKSESFLKEKIKSERKFIDPEKNPDEYMMRLRNGR